MRDVFKAADASKTAVKRNAAVDAFDLRRGVDEPWLVELTSC